MPNLLRLFGKLRVQEMLRRPTADLGARIGYYPLRVFGLEGLRVADASIFPTMPSGNTNAPVMLIAERTARAILG